MQNKRAMACNSYCRSRNSEDTTYSHKCDMTAASALLITYHYMQCFNTYINLYNKFYVILYENLYLMLRNIFYITYTHIFIFIFIRNKDA